MRYSRISDKPFVTYVLIALCIGMFAVTTITGGLTNNLVLINFGGRYAPNIYAGEWWRLVTATFLHGGFMHIGFNMLSLYFLGPATERFFGHWRFLTIFIISGITGNFAGLLFNNPNVIGIGASTAIFGLLGAFLMLGDNFRDNPGIAALTRQFLILIAINLVFDFTQTNIDIAGHIGGLVGGFLIAGVLGAPRFGQIPVWKRVAMGVILVAACGALFAVYGSVSL